VVSVWAGFPSSGKVHDIHTECRYLQPPQAEGRNISEFPKVDNNDPPELTSIFFSPLMVKVTGPGWR